MINNYSAHLMALVAKQTRKRNEEIRRDSTRLMSSKIDKKYNQNNITATHMNKGIIITDRKDISNFT